MGAFLDKTTSPLLIKASSFKYDLVSLFSFYSPTPEAAWILGIPSNWVLIVL